MDVLDGVVCRKEAGGSADNRVLEDDAAGLRPRWKGRGLSGEGRKEDVKAAGEDCC